MQKTFLTNKGFKKEEIQERLDAVNPDAIA
jgi:hypothetical protein